MRKNRQFLMLSVVMLCLAGCSSKMSYHYADWIIDWMVDDYVDWNKNQQKQFDKALDDALIWHKKTQLLEYRDWLVELKATSYQQPDTAMIINALAPLESFTTAILLYVFDDAVSLLSSLTDEQVNIMMKALQEQHQDLVDEYRDETPKKWQQRQLKTVEKLSNRFLGKLHDEQQPWVDTWLSKQQNLNHLWLDNRQNWINALGGALTSRHSPTFNEQLKVLLLTPQSLHNETYAQAIQQNINNTAELISTLLANLKPEQRKKLDKQFDKYIRLLEDLAE